jgi:imidazolonepropionase-like amidohydrolase
MDDMELPSRPAVTLVLALIALGCGGSRAVDEPADGAAGTVAFVNVNVVPMTSDAVLPSHTVVIRGDRIVEVAPSRSVTLAEGTRTIDASGRYLVPGLVDFHVHLRAESELESYLRHGVTTVVALRGTETVLALRDKVRSGALDGPRIFTAGPLIDGDPPIWPGGATRVVTTAAEARAAADAHCGGGHDVVKVYNNLAPDLLAEVVARAHACGLPVVAHLPRRPVREQGLERALAAGVDVIAHGEEVFFTHLGGASDALIERPGAAVSDERIATAVRSIRESGAYVSPTLSFIAMTARMLEDVDAVFADPEFERLAPDVQRLWRDQNPTRRANLDAFRRRERVKRAAVTVLTARLQAAGVPLLLGTDASAPGLFPGKSAHLELEELVRSGLTPFEAIAAGTSTPGRFFHERLRAAGPGETAAPSGTIEPGRRADLLLVGADPLASVRNLALIEGVMVRGHWRPAQR